MGFTRKTWQNRLVEFAGRRKLTNVSTGTQQVVDVVREEGSVSQEGSAFDAANMNDLEQRIADGVTGVETTLTQRLGGLEFRYQGGKGYYRAVGADTWIPFSGFQKFTANWSWNSSGSTTVNINISSMPAYKSLTKDSMVATFGSVRGGVSNTGAPVNVIMRSMSYNANTGIASVVVGYDTWCVTALSGVVVLIVAG